MAKKKDFSKMDHTNLMKEASAVHESIQDLGARANAILDMADAYQHSPEVGLELDKEFIEDIDHGKLTGYYKDIRGARTKRGKALSDTQIKKYMKEILEHVMPPLKYGVKGNTDLNYSNFEMYARQLGKDGEKMLEEVKNSIRHGDGLTAVHTILQIIRLHKKGTAHHQFYDALVPVDNYDLKDKLGDTLADRIEGHLGKGKKPRAGLIKDDIHEAVKKYGSRAYQDMYKEYNPTDQTPKGKE